MGIAAFGSVEAHFVKVLLEVAFVLLLISCGLLIWNFVIMRGLYEELSTVIHHGETPSASEQAKMVQRREKDGQNILKVENYTIWIQLAVAVLLFIIMNFVLFGESKNKSYTDKKTYTESRRGSHYWKYSQRERGTLFYSE